MGRTRSALLEPHPWQLASEHGAPLEELALIDAAGLAEIFRREPAGLTEERERVAPDDGLDIGFGDAGLPEGMHRLGDLERVADAPICRAVDEDPRGAIAL